MLEKLSDAAQFNIYIEVHCLMQARKDGDKFDTLEGHTSKDENEGGSGDDLASCLTE
jgi:hypothetical protein